MPKVHASEANSFETLLRKFRRMCDKALIPMKLREQEFYEKPTAKRKRLKKAAEKRDAKRIRKEMEVLERERTRF